MEIEITYFSPDVLLQKYENQCTNISDVDFFNRSKSDYQKLREMWCAGTFGKGYSKFVFPCEVGINLSNFRLDADFFIKVKGNYYPFQIAEALEKGRLRGQEYKNFKKGSIQSVPYRPENGRINGPNWIKNVVKKKVDKVYEDSQALNLLVYANFHATELDRDEIIKLLGTFQSNFQSLWIITNLEICSIFSVEALGKINAWSRVYRLGE